MASEPHQIRMRDDAIVDVDREIVGRIARAPLRHEAKVPRPIISELACATEKDAIKQLAAAA
jgi:hypothetical protein